MFLIRNNRLHVCYSHYSKTFGSFMQNALAMGIDLSDVSAVVLSHG
ncbi:hypothetical protein MJN51_20005, partial [Salmonella enterica subsp. enterica serovar Kentucky]|nr:hypothetical protein [Salmonella enterica subsp. enterica serovar Kentucky]